jgi:hypothetical protein
MLSSNEIALMKSQQNTALPDSMTITRKSFSPNGSGGMTESESTLGPFACRLSSANGDEKVEAMRATEIGDAILTYASTVGLLATDLVNIGDQVFEVKHIEEPRGWKTAGRAMLRRRGA